MGWFARLILGPDAKQHTNLKITLGGQLGYLCNLCLIWYGTHTGLIDADVAWPVTFLVAATMLAFYLLLRTGWSRRFADPGLTVVQMITGNVLNAVGQIVAPAIHIGLLMPVATTLAHSVFALKGHQVRFVQVVTMVIFIATSAVMCYLQPRFYNPYIEVYVLAALAVTVVMLTWSGSRLAHLRTRQRLQREELTETLQRIETLASRDALTGLYNRRHMNVLLAHHAERALRGDADPTVALVDLDHFKQINDAYGHGAGDEALQTFARVMQSELPTSDTLARWGGEEFMLLSTSGPADVLALLERVRARLQQTPLLAQDPNLRINFSAGVAVYQPQEHVSHTVHRADLALYQAKDAGRAQSRLAAVDETATAPVATAAGTRTNAPLAAPLRPAATTAPSAGEAAQHPANVITDTRRPPFAWLLGQDVHRRTWTTRTLIGTAPYLFGIFGSLYLVAVGSMAAITGWALAFGLSLTAVMAYALVRSGWTEPLKDPALTLFQMLAAATWAAVLYVTTSHAHSAQLIFLVMLVTMSVCTMSRRGAWAVCGYAMAVMSVAIWAMSRLEPSVYVPEVELANWIQMMFNLPTLMLMGVQLSSLRTRLRTQRSQLKAAVERLGQLATHDELTGLNNRAYMNEMLAHYERRCAQANEVFTLAIVDLDHFKQVNDRYGHAVGDEVLQAFARLAADTLRQVDVIARWGGEEFLILWPQTSPEQAMIGLERLRRAFAALEVSQGVTHLRASFSAGLVSPQCGEPIDKALADADEALYSAKRLGRNRTCVHGMAPPVDHVAAP